MNLRRGRRVLRGIERDLAQSDPGLAMFFVSFTARAKGAEMPDTEQIKARSRRPFGRLGRRADRHRAGEDRWARAPDESLGPANAAGNDVCRDGGV
jgi:hypothetical protein